MNGSVTSDGSMSALPLKKGALNVPGPTELDSSTAMNQLRTLSHLNSDTVNLEATRQYIQKLDEKIGEYKTAFVKHQVDREDKTSKFIDDLDRCGSDVRQQENMKKRLHKDQEEYSMVGKNLQRNILKLEYKLQCLLHDGIPKSVVPDDYVRQLRKKEEKKKKIGILHVPNLPKNLGLGEINLPSSFQKIINKTPSSGDLLNDFKSNSNKQKPALSDSPMHNKDASAVKAKSQSLEHETLDSRNSRAYSEACTASSSDRDRDLLLYPPPTIASSDVTHRPLPRSHKSARSKGSNHEESKSDPKSKSALDEQRDLEWLSLSDPPAVDSKAHFSSASNLRDPGTKFSIGSNQCDALKSHYDKLLTDNKAYFETEISNLRKKFQVDLQEVNLVVHEEIRKLRCDQLDLSAANEDNKNDLEKLKVFLNTLSKGFHKVDFIEQQVEEMTNKLAVMSRDFQSSECSHRVVNTSTLENLGTRFLNLIVSIMSYGFVAISIFLNFLTWLFGILGSRLFIIFVLIFFVTIPIYYSWDWLLIHVPQIQVLLDLIQLHCPPCHELFLTLKSKFSDHTIHIPTEL